LLDTHLQAFVRSQIRECLQEQFKDQKVIEVEMTEAIAERFQKWGKWFLIPVTILYTLIGAALGLLGVTDFVRVHHAANEAVQQADTAKNKALDAQRASDNVRAQLQEIVSHADENTAAEIEKARKHIGREVDELDKKIGKTDEQVEGVTNLVTASLLASEGEQAVFTTGSSRRVFNTKEFAEPTGEWVFMLLKKVPIFQTIQLQTGRTVEPRWTYRQEGNILIFRWRDLREKLEGVEINVGYVPDPRKHLDRYQSLSLRNGHVWGVAVAGGQDKEMLPFDSQHPQEER